MKSGSILHKARLLLVIVGGSMLLTAIVQVSLGFRVASESDHITKIDLPMALNTLSMLRELGEMNSNLLEYTLGESEEKEEFYDNFEDFQGFRHSLDTQKFDNREMSRLDRLLAYFMEQAEKRVFGTFDPSKEKRAKNNIVRLMRDVGSPLEKLLTKMKDEEILDSGKTTNLQDILEDDLPGVRYYLELNKYAGDMLAALDRFVLGDSNARRLFFSHALLFETSLAHLKPLEQRNDEVTRIKEIERLFAELKTGGDEVFSIYRTSDLTDAMQAIDDTEHHNYKDSVLLLNSLSEKSRKKVEERMLSLATMVNQVNGVLFIYGIGVTLLMIFGMRYIHRWIVSPIQEVAGHIKRLHAGERNIDIHSSSRTDEIGDIINSVRQFQTQLTELDALRDFQLQEAEQAHIQRLQMANDELKAREHELLTNSQELQLANKDLEHFVHIASHDLREPLKKLSGYCSVFEAQVADILPDSAKGSLKKIRENARYMVTLVDDLRLLTKLKSTSLEWKICELNTVLELALTEYAEQLQRRSVVLRMSDLPAVTCVPNLIRQVFDNLIRNALSHGPEKLEIHVKSRYEEHVWTISFITNSPMPGNDQDRLFLPFVRGENTKKGENTGMGLAICRKIIEVHGGKIWIENNENQEFQVCFTLMQSVRQQIPERKLEEVDPESVVQMR